MKSILIGLILFGSNYGRANCELATRRFHTFATYEFPKSSSLKANLVYMRDGGMLFSEDISDYLEKNNFLKKDAQFGSVKHNGSTFTLEKSTLAEFPSVKGPLPFLRLSEHLNGLPSEPIAIFDSKLRTISTTGEMFQPGPRTEKKASEPLPSPLTKAFQQAIAKSDFSLVKELKNYKAGAVTGWTRQKLGEKDWELIQIQAQFQVPEAIYWSGPEGDQKEVKEVTTITGWLAFLTPNGKDFWYIGNSSGSPCGHDLHEEVTSSTGPIKNHTANIGLPLEANYGLRFADSGSNTLIYSLGDTDIIYHLTFNEGMVVILNAGYR